MLRQKHADGAADAVNLRSLVRVPRAEPGAPLVIAFHGKGMTARTFARALRPAVESEGLSWWVPRGILPAEVTHRRIGYGWYVFDGNQEALRESMDQARAYVLHLTAMAQRALRPRWIALLGFSQGAYLASYAALSRPDLFKALVCCCGRPKVEFVETLEAARDLRVLVQRGLRDPAFPAELIAKGVDPLKAAGLRVEERTYDSEHVLVPEMAADAARFLT
ncbi:MAG: alpha/beta hydrolase [Planctomycetota bacterium]|jgi:predicted esterase